jgi:ketosteroid isomerase-like protein
MTATDDIKKVGDTMNALVAKGDIPGIMQLMTDDVVFLPPNDTPKVGKAAYLTWVQQFQDRFAVKSTTKSREIRVADDLGYEWGMLQETFTPRDPSVKPVNFDGKFLRVFFRQPDGSWKIARATWSSDLPAGS